VIDSTRMIIDHRQPGESRPHHPTGGRTTHGPHQRRRRAPQRVSPRVAEVRGRLGSAGRLKRISQRVSGWQAQALAEAGDPQEIPPKRPSERTAPLPV